MKLKQLESALQCVQEFHRPKVSLEQYSTRPELAAQILYNITDDIEDQSVADLGCGPGRLGIGCSLLGSWYQIHFIFLKIRISPL
jgi:predicted RNA methylase